MASRQELQVQQKRELEKKEEMTIPARVFLPTADIYETNDALNVVLEMPGVDKDDLQIQAKANTIRISGRKNVGYSDGASVHRRERVSGEFDRTLSLPIELDPNGIKAEYRDGLLALYLPRAESDKPRSIKVK